MTLDEARQKCRDIVAIERGDAVTCLHLQKPFCGHPAHFFCVFHLPESVGFMPGSVAPTGSIPMESAGSHPCEPAGSAVLTREVPALETPSAAEDGDTRRPHLSVSAVQTWRTCPRKYNLFYVRRLRPVHKAQALVMGDLMDRGLRPIIQTGRWELADLALTDEERETLGTDGLARLYASLDGFRDHATLKPTNGVCQYPARFTWCGEAAIGYLDYWDQSKTIWEFKFLERIEVCPSRYKLQMAIYARATGAQRIVYYPIRKPELKHTQKESTDQFQARILADIARRPGHYYQPREYLPSELIVYLDDITPWEIRRALENGKLEDFPHNWGACDMYNGCEYQPICQSGGLIDDALYIRKT